MSSNLAKVISPNFLALLASLKKAANVEGCYGFTQVRMIFFFGPLPNELSF